MAGKQKAKPVPEPDDKAQSQRFVETARELGIDDNSEAFKRALDVVVVSTVVPDRNENSKDSA